MCTLLVVQQVDRLKNMVHNKFRKDRIMKQRNVLTSAGGGGRRSTGKSSEIASNLAKCRTGSAGGFTMAEILLSLTIIGVVAAITLPSLTGNINERTWNTQRKALYARFSQAIALMPSLNGYGTLREETDSAGSTSIEDTAAETFVTAGLSKVLKINNICDSEHLHDCGLPEKITTLASENISFPLTLSQLNPKNIDAVVDWVSIGGTFNPTYETIDSKAAGIETSNGESIAVYYNPTCTKLAYTTYYMSQNYMCANFIYDLNGTKGPNTFGKDLGIITAFYPTDSEVVAPDLAVQDAVSSIAADDIGSVCKKQDDSYRMPSQLELASMFTNKNIIGNMDEERYWSSSLSTSGSGGRYSANHWYINYSLGIFNSDTNLDNMAVRCVKR